MLKSVVFLASFAVSSAQLSNVPKLKRIRTETIKKAGSSEFGRRGNLRSTSGAASEGKTRQLELSLSMDFSAEAMEEEPSEEEKPSSCTANEECASGVCDCRFNCALCSTHPLLHFDYWCGTCAGL